MHGVQPRHRRRPWARCGATLIGAAACALALLAAWMLPGVTPAAGSSPASFGERYIVVYDANQHARSFSVTEETTQREQRMGFSSSLRYRHAIKGFSARLSNAQVKRLERDSEVALVTPDRPLKAATVGLAPGDNVPSGVARIGAAISGTVHEPSDTAVAVLDTGIDLAHPDLNAESGANCVGSGPATDNNGHGTQVAGVIAAKNNGSGAVGVAPGTKLVSVKILDRQGVSSTSGVICGVDWVTGHAASLGIKVANLSIDGLAPYSTCTTDPLHAAVCGSTAAGVTYTVAAGNYAADIGAYPLDVPASYPEVLTVTAMSDTDGHPGGVGAPPGCPDGSSEGDDRYASFSNYAVSPGDANHTIAAPGVCINSTALGRNYETLSGTSAATPHVAATVALCFNEGGRDGPCAGLRPAEVIQKIRADAARIATTSNGFVGDPNSPIGVYYGFLVSVVESTKLPPPPLTQAASSPDRSVSFRLLRIRSRGGRLYVSARMNEAGSLSASGAVRVSRRAAKLYRFRRAAKQLASAATIRLVLRVDRRSRQTVRRALRRGRRVIAKIVVRATDVSGNSARKRRTARLRR